ncbi:PilZ domain-containing protein [Arenimonas fontis]|uniref:PilZ domain-containing protein n=1 Tax=Arenimonas fontis TaxID=2608255 RepID=A0A5B2ZDP3_9GAMM|nr:PilZ domain-containing protein [Arenimonas fontis]KAA2285330.1 PilZ domain-containing protein [Arenimonas fontis]
MNQPSTDYRRAKRRKVGFSVDVTDTMTGEVVGKLSNLSETGMLLVLGRPLVDDALYQMRFLLPVEGGGMRSIEVGAHELWSDDAAAPGQVWTGFRFIDVAPDDVAFIREWVDAPGSQYV